MIAILLHGKPNGQGGISLIETRFNFSDIVENTIGVSWKDNDGLHIVPYQHVYRLTIQDTD